MLKIRLRRIGKKKHPVYRLIVSPKTKDTKGDFLEDLGFYNPLLKPAVFEINQERVKYWLAKGAKPSGTVHNLLVDQKIISEAKVKKGGKAKKSEGPKKEEVKKKEEVIPENKPKEELVKETPVKK